MVFDPLKKPDLFLAPLGRQFGYSDPPGSTSQKPGEVYIGGYLIYDPFLPLLTLMGGVEIVGEPLTMVRFNPIKNRYEQIFENIGYFQGIDTNDSSPHLLTFGVYNCDIGCSYIPQWNAIIDPFDNLPEPFSSAVARLGTSFTGQILSGEHHTEDRNIEIIFENVVLFVDPNNPKKVRVRPIVELLGFTPHPLADRLQNKNPLEAFYSIDGEKGHNIPLVIFDYITLHGGFDIVGTPISEIFKIDEGNFRQCFANICLDYFTSTKLDLHIRPTALGGSYLSQFYDPVIPANNAASLQRVTQPKIELTTWEEKTLISASDSQVIYAKSFNGDTPLANIALSLIQTLPDGSQNLHQFPPTSEIGISSIVVSPISMTNGSLIHYEVCLDGNVEDVICVSENYLIWTNP